jgi:hypothetical protein
MLSSTYAWISTSITAYPCIYFIHVPDLPSQQLMYGHTHHCSLEASIYIYTALGMSFTHIMTGSGLLSTTTVYHSLIFSCVTTDPKYPGASTSPHCAPAALASSSCSSASSMEFVRNPTMILDSQGSLLLGAPREHPRPDPSALQLKDGSLRPLSPIRPVPECRIWRGRCCAAPGWKHGRKLVAWWTTFSGGRRSGWARRRLVVAAWRLVRCGNSL